jgi:hypothetical protein
LPLGFLANTILQAPPDLIRSLLLKSFPTPSEGHGIPFPEFARSLHAFADYKEQFPAHDLAVEPIVDLGIAGPEKWVKSLTGSLKLLR